MIKIIIFSVLYLFSTFAQAQQFLFDSHLHYGGEDVKQFTPKQIIKIFDRNHIKYAVVSSTPNQGTESLYAYAPNRIIPFLGLYQTLGDKRDWMYDESVVARVEEALNSGIYRGLGELHIFAKDRKSPVLRRIVEIASERNLMLQVHGDAEILDEIFSLAPNVTILWAHLGTRPEPEFLRGVLTKYPQNLFIDTSVRDKQLLESGELTDDWKKLFIDYQDQFTVAVDTFSVNRWNTFDLVVQDIRSWLADLPDEVVRKLAYDNAYKLFFNEKVD
ncbi:amidohydrolase family protein [Thiomicrorhabdus immobilis]|uniref:amidohydrolase family protein n=1 Tax=Thiomicrorhabdus immobilis TaxID=2791037 RepID=UPI001F477431|nr:amidohydrolase family protein [Thiomicrorhabdus immobilis]